LQGTGLIHFREKSILKSKNLPIVEVHAAMKPLIIGIAGGSGSGKTTVTQKIIDKLDQDRIAVVQHDSYYRDISYYGGRSPAEINFDHPDSLETSLLIGHIKKFKRGETIEQPIYNFTTHARMKECKIIPPKDLLIIEGILIYVEKELRELMDIKIYVDTDADERLIRRLRRDILERGRSLDSVINQYSNTVKPMHLEFVEPSKRWADIIIPKGGENKVAIDMIVSKIRSLYFAQPQIA
jgi:uridine kinase